MDARPPKGQRLRIVGGSGAPASVRYCRFHRRTSRQALAIRSAYGHEDTDALTGGDLRLNRYLARSRPTGLAPRVTQQELTAPPAGQMVGRGHPCHYCGQPAEGIDHVWPRSRGGDDHSNNLVRACVPCNSTKGNKSLFGTRCPGCGETRHPSDVDTANQSAFYACRCGQSWSASVDLQRVRL
jgi:5-methylcytosine-specific restriction endonuclease McrA